MPAPWLPTDERPGRCPIVVFCGKGGVGKTTLSLSLALEYARRGKRVIVVSSQPLSDMAVTVSLDSLVEGDVRTSANLVVTCIDAREILATMFERQFPSPFVAQRVLNSGIYRNLIEVAPGLKELAFLSRLRELAEGRSHVSGAADAVIWDAPASGHFLQTLNTTHTFDSLLSGPFATASRELQRFFTERANLIVVPVTTLEEMAVAETVELWQTLRNRLHVQPAAVACNMVSPMLQSSSEHADIDLQEPDACAPPGHAHFAFVVERRRIERDEFARLRSSLPGPFHLIRRVAEWTSDLALLRAVSAQMTNAPAG